ncbi:MAG: hypothetical protein ACRD1C_03755 [Terriglobales bacterium]
MAIASTILNVIGARRRTIRQLALTLSGNYSTGGDTLDLTATTNPNYLPAAKAFSASPDSIVILNHPDGYGVEIKPGNALNNNLVKFYTAAGTELAEGAYPAALSGATDIVAEVISKTNM